MQSVIITTKVVSSNPIHWEVYSIQHYGIKLGIYIFFRIRVMVFNSTSNNIAIISLQSVLLAEETGVLK
jgi:hypothetical protein